MLSQVVELIESKKRFAITSHIRPDGDSLGSSLGLYWLLRALDKEVEAKTSTWKTRGFVTFHGSFGYFAERYHLIILAVIEPFPGSTPTGHYIEEVLRVARHRKVTAIFSEPQLDPRPAKTIADEAHVPPVRDLIAA